MVISTAQLHSTNPELRFCAGSNSARNVSEIRNWEDLWQVSRLALRLNAFRRSTYHKNNSSSSSLLKMTHKQKQSSVICGSKPLSFIMQNFLITVICLAIFRQCSGAHPKLIIHNLKTFYPLLLLSYTHLEEPTHIF